MGTVCFTEIEINMKLFGYILALASVSQAAVMTAFINGCENKANVGTVAANAYKTKALNAVTRLNLQATIVEASVDTIKGHFASLIDLKNGISVNQPNRDAVIARIMQQMTNLRSQMTQKVANCRSYRVAAADVRKNAKVAITKLADQFTAWSDVVESALNRLESRFKGKAVFAALHQNVMDTVTAFETCVLGGEQDIAGVRQSFGAFEADAEGSIDDAENSAKAALAYMNSNM